MERLFLERCGELAGRPGAEARLWVEACWDLVDHGLRERTSRVVAAFVNERREGTMMDGWTSDLRFGVRSLLRRPGFTLAAGGTLALGIGATVAIFSVVNGVLLRPLPYPESERLVKVWKVSSTRGPSTSVDHPDVRAWQDAVPGLAVSGFSSGRPTLTGLGDPQVLRATRVTDGLVTTFGLEPDLGRDLERADDTPDGPRVAVVSHAFWTTRLGADPGALGTILTLDGAGWEIVGVAPEDFREPDGTQVWLPRRHDPEACGHGCNTMEAVARLPAGMEMPALQERLTAVDRVLAAEHPDAHRDVVTEIQPLHDYRVADVRPALWILLAAVGMVLLVACANVANLLMVRAAGRRTEVAVRVTLGAGRRRLIRQLLTESLLLAMVGGGLGLALASVGVSGMVSMAPPELPRMAEVALDGRVVLFATSVTLAVALLFGLLPAAHLARRATAASLRGARGAVGGTPGRRGRSSRFLLLTGEVALSLSLLLGAALLFRTLQEVRSVDPGFRTEGVERFRIAAPGARYDTEAALAFFDELEERLQAEPAIRRVGTGFGIPLAPGNLNVSVQLRDRPPVPGPDRPTAAVRLVSPGYRQALGIPLRQGRWLAPGDRTDAPGAVVLNETAARSFYPDGEALGKRLVVDMTWGFDEQPERTVVGVVGDVRTRSLTQPEGPAIYVPNAQMGANIQYVLMELEPGAGSALPVARAIVAELDPTLALTYEERMEEVMRHESAGTRFYLTLLSFFSGLAVVLAAVGLYGVVAYAVSRRTRELGIRMALGAEADQVVGLVVRQGLAPALLGIVLGLALSWFGARSLQALLYGVEPQDPLTLVVVTGILAVVTAAAVLLPARRATRIPPATALRSE